MLKNLLLSEKWRPKKLDDLILLPRIKKVFEGGLSQNVILYGHYGTGKTSLARILIGRYSKDKAFLEINSSFYTSIETLRNKIDDFCSKVYMGFDLEDVPTDPIKYVFLDEFERTSQQYQDALKAYIEEYSSKNVRFILNTNHINKISPGIRSRFVEINFDSINAEEEKWIKINLFKFISEKIVPSEDFDIKKEDLIKLINKKFPDIRSVMIELEYYKHTGSGSDSTSNIDTKLRLESYNLIFENLDYNTIFHFIMDNFGAEKSEEFLNLFTKDFIMWCVEVKNVETKKLFKINLSLAESLQMIQNEIDPIIVVMSFIGKCRDIILD
jgi:DNA polymerase III delta prime subunit